MIIHYTNRQPHVRAILLKDLNTMSPTAEEVVAWKEKWTIDAPLANLFYFLKFRTFLQLLKRFEIDRLLVTYRYDSLHNTYIATFYDNHDALLCKIGQ